MKKYTQAQRKLIVEALKETKKTLWRGDDRDRAWQYQFICLSVPETYGGNLVRKIIRSRLGFCISVEHWLEKNLTGFSVENDRVQRYYYFNQLLTCKDIQDYRHRWIKELINEFSQ